MLFSSLRDAQRKSNRCCAALSRSVHATAELGERYFDLVAVYPLPCMHVVIRLMSLLLHATASCLACSSVTPGFSNDDVVVEQAPNAITANTAKLQNIAFMTDPLIQTYGRQLRRYRVAQQLFICQIRPDMFC